MKNIFKKNQKVSNSKNFLDLHLSVKRGETPRSEASAEVLKIVDSMSEKKIRDFASTPHSEVPKKVTEAIANPGGVPVKNLHQQLKNKKKLEDRVLKNKQRQYEIGEDMAPTNPDQITAQRKLIDAQRLLTTANKKALKQNSQQNPQVQNQSYEPEGEVVDEARRSEKEGKGSPESPLSYPGRKVQKERGDKGGRHWQSGGEGGSTTERGRKKSDQYSQTQRLRRLSNYPENPGKYSEMQRKKRGGDIGSRFD